MKKFFEKIKNYLKKVESNINEYTQGNSTAASNPARSYVDWAMKLMDEGYEDVAIEKLETVTQMAMQNPAACVNLAMTYIKRGEFEKVPKLLKKAVEIDSQYARAYLTYGIYYTALNNYKNAEHYYEIAAKLDPRLPEVFVNWAVSLVSQGKRNEADEKFKQAMFYQPNNLVGLYLWAILDIDLGRLVQAKDKLSVVLSFQPHNPDALYYMSVVYYREKNYPAAIELTSHALSVKSDNPLLYGLLADSYCAVDKYDKALDIYKKLDEKILYDEKTFLFWGENALNNKDIESSMYAYKKVLKNNPECMSAKKGLVENYMYKGDFSEAKNILLEILNKEPSDAEVLLNLYKIENAENNIDDAIEYLYNAIKYDTQNKKYNYELGILYEKAGKTQKAKEAYLRMIEYQSDNMEAYYSYAKLFIEDNPKEALRKIRTAYNSDKDNTKYAKLYLEILVKNENYKIAIELANEILKKNPKDYEVLYLKVNSLLNIGKYKMPIEILYNLPQDKKETEKFDYMLLWAYKLRAKETNEENNVKEMNDFSYYLSQKYSQNEKFMVKLKELEETFKNEE